MAFITIPPSWIIPGEPVKNELWSLTKDNLDDLNSRLSTTETAVNQAQSLPYFISGQLQLIGVKQGIFRHRLPTGWTLLSGRIRQFTTSGSGTFEFDIQYKRGANPYASIFTVKPSVTVANGDNYSSVNGVLAESVLLAGDDIRFDITSTQVNSVEGAWLLALEYELS